MKKKKYRYPTLTISISEEHRRMYNELRNKHYLNMSKIIRDTIERLYEGVSAKKMS
jgi:hypothetical protein